MSSPKPEKTAYDILGVARTASADEIKKRYRELARTSHPDVNQSNPNAAKIFAEITTAYKTISDSQTRAAYDAELSLRDRQVQQAAQRQTARPQTATGAGATRGTARPSPQPVNPANAAEAQRLTSEAQTAFSRGKFIEAQTKAEQALRLGRRNAAAYEILGDVYRLQGKTDQAISMYTYALQINQYNPQLRARMERLARTSSTYKGPSAERVFFDNNDASPGSRPGARSAPSAPSSPPSLGLSAEKRPIAQMLVGLIGYGSILFLMLYVLQNPGDVHGKGFLPLISTWNGTILTALGLSGLLLGATMAITGVIQRIEDELLYNSGGGRGSAPFGPILILLGTLNFYVGIIVYGLIALTQGTFTRSMQFVFGSIFAVTLLLALAFQAGTGQVLLWGGGIVFFTYVIGWVLGDVFRTE